MAKRKPVRKSAPKKKVVKSVALVRAPKVLPAVVEQDRQLERVVQEGAFRLDALGLVELHATKEEELVLAREARAIDVLIKPTGEPYLPHPVYTRWLNEAFGRGAWSLVPVGAPKLAQNSVVCPYVLYVHKQPVAFAQGEQEYFEKNARQSFGDALESTVGNALRRVCKHLGIGLELWDRRWLTAWRKEHAIQVTVETNVKNKETGAWEKKKATQWRRKDDEPLKGELNVGRAPAPERDQEEHSKLDEKISDAKRLRFWRIARRVGRKEDDIKRWLKKHYKIEDTHLITNRDYDKIVRILEAKGDLPNGREPGQEG